jgi:hypothetical protein
MSDTQMELRLYSAEFLSYPSSAVRYEFEIEKFGKTFMVRWQNDGKTLYDETHVTHFDQLKNNLHMIFLHAQLVIL